MDRTTLLSLEVMDRTTLLSDSVVVEVIVTNNFDCMLTIYERGIPCCGVC